MTPITAIMAQAIKSVLATFSVILPLVLLPFCFTWAGGMMGSLYKWSRGLGEATRGLRQGFAAGVGNSRLGNWAEENVRGNGFWRGARTVLARTVVGTTDVATLTALDRRLAANRTAREAGLARFEAARGARSRNAAVRAAAIRQRDAQLSNDLNVAQTLVQTDVLDRAGVAPAAFLTAYAESLRGGPSTMVGARGTVDFKKLTKAQEYGIASLAAESGDVNTLAALRVYNRSQGFQTGLDRAMVTHADKIRSSGGAFLLRPELRDEQGARRVTANGFGVRLETAQTAQAAIRGRADRNQLAAIAEAARAVGAGSATSEQKALHNAVTTRKLSPKMNAALAASNASLQDIMDYHMALSAFDSTPEKVATLKKDHQETLANVLSRAAAIDNAESVDAYMKGTPTVSQRKQVDDAIAAAASSTATPWQQAIDDAVKGKPLPVRASDYNLYRMIYAKIGEEDAATHTTAVKRFATTMNSAFDPRSGKELISKMQNPEVANRVLKAFERFA